MCCFIFMMILNLMFYNVEEDDIKEENGQGQGHETCD